MGWTLRTELVMLRCTKSRLSWGCRGAGLENHLDWFLDRLSGGCKGTGLENRLDTLKHDHQRWARILPSQTWRKAYMATGGHYIGSTT